jgi:hypothetical protein
VLEESGLGRYVDAKYLQREIAEANDMTSEELDRAAHELLAQSPTNTKLPYYEHLGGYSMQEMHDYNQYSQQHDDLLPHTPSKHTAYSDDFSDTEGDADQMVYVTTL